MIPRGRPAIDAARFAALLGMAYKTWHTQGVAHSEGAPRPVNPGRRKLLYDLAQAEAFRDGTPLPPLPQGEDPSDLLDEREAAELLGVSYETVRKDRRIGRLPESVEVCGVHHFRRGDLQRVPAEMRPGRGVGGGRPRRSQRNVAD
jgi:hypothetical protein